MENKRINKSHQLLAFSFMFISFFAIIIIGCTSEKITNDTNLTTIASCEGCHTNYAHLQEVFSPDTVAPAGGCGGDAPHYEPYDRVYMGGDGMEAYKNSGHYAIGCVSCHKGTDNTADKDLAHSGDFIRHPSVFAQETCGTCHQSIVNNFSTSLHQGTGQKRKVTIRSGLSGPEDFDKLPQHQIEGYSKNCATCHAGCGECHIVRPPIGGGGLMNGHEFIRTPNMLAVCVTCHTSRGGHAFLGVASGTKPDVHLKEMGYKCLDCHTGNEMHGDGNKVEQRYAYSKLPKCKDCHNNIEESNSFHDKHIEDFNCQVCHSQKYNNCGSCHIHGEGARVPSYMDFKIGLNPLPEIKDDYEFALIRRTLADPDNWKEYGVDQYENFDAFPTYNYTTPHNILRWTKRTQVDAGKSCGTNCHIRNENGVLINKELYLFEENLLDWEKEATKKITVDDELPDSWFR